MPQPTLQDVHVNRPLTNISVAYSQEAAGVEYVADRAFPPVPVASKSDSYYTYARQDFNRNTMQKRGLSAESAGSGYGLDANGNYTCEVWALHKDVDDQIRANSDSPLAPDRDATIFLTQQAMISREVNWANKYFVNGVWTGNAAGAAASDATFSNSANCTYWDYSTSTPITDFRHAKTLMRLNSGGFTGNIGCLSRPVFDKLVDHPDFIDRMNRGQTSGAAMANRIIMAQILELDEILVMDAVVNNGQEGATESNAFIGGLNAALFYRPKQAGLMTPSAGYTFNWTGLMGSVGNAGLRIKSFRMEHLASDRVEIDSAYAMGLVAVDCGFMFNNIISAA